MAPRETLPVVLLAIHPEYAQAILAGTKKVEFRKTPPRRPFSCVAIYATSPTKGIVGICEIKETVEASPSKLWGQYAKVAGITKRAFFDYFSGSTKGYALVIGKTVPYVSPLRLSSLKKVIRVPQSFLYLSQDVFPEQSLHL